MRKPENELTIIASPYLRVNDTETMLDLALNGLGIAKLHRYIVQEHLERGSLQEILTSYTQSEIPIYVAYPQRRYLPSKVRCFIDFTTKKISIPKQPEESVFGKAAPQNFDSERATIAGGKARVRIKILR
ncbi:MAG TPA: hypothetical protein DCE71_08640 [Parachlamydiales bacterium]|nr:hypothetical protein [Parachlamydiales bacterium]